MAFSDNTAVECCNKIRVESNGEAKTTHFWTLGTFVKNDTLSLKGVTYEQIKFPGNIDQYYLAGTKNDGWKVNIFLPFKGKFICRVVYSIEIFYGYNVYFYVSLFIEIRLVGYGMEISNHWFTTMLPMLK